MKIPGRLVLEYSFILNVVILLYSCENVDNKSSNNYKIKNTNLELGKESIDQFNRIFEGFYFNDIYQQFNSGYLILHPKLNEKYINYSDTAHFVFFALEGDSIEDLIITVNKKGCFASIVYNLDGYLYPNQSVIFPGDYSFLNKDQLPVNFDCINQDSLSLREVAFDANMLGVWYVDSISSIRRNFNQSFDIKNITIEKQRVIVNDSLDFEYYHSGYDFQLNGTNYFFYKVLVNEDHMIMINTYRNSYEEFYFVKRNATRKCFGE